MTPNDRVAMELGKLVIQICNLQSKLEDATQLAELEKQQIDELQSKLDVLTPKPESLTVAGGDNGQ